MDKTTFKQKAKDQIDHLFHQIDELEKKKDHASDSAKRQYEQTLADLKSRRQDLEAKYDDLTQASDEKWEEVKSAFADATGSFKEGVGKLTAVFS